MFNSDGKSICMQKVEENFSSVQLFGGKNKTKQNNNKNNPCTFNLLVSIKIGRENNGEKAVVLWVFPDEQADVVAVQHCFNLSGLGSAALRARKESRLAAWIYRTAESLVINELHLKEPKMHLYICSKYLWVDMFYQLPMNDREIEVSF